MALSPFWNEKSIYKYFGAQQYCVNNGSGDWCLRVDENGSFIISRGDDDIICFNSDDIGEWTLDAPDNLALDLFKGGDKYYVYNNECVR